MSLIQTSSNQPSPAFVGLSSPMQSQRSGQAQLLPDLHSTLSDAAEELTQSLSGKAQEKSLKERKADSGKSLADLSRAQRLAMFQAMAGGGSADGQADAEQKIAQLAQKALRQPGQARRQAKESGGDASEQYLALLEAADLIQDGKIGHDPGGRATDSLREAAAELFAEHGREIRADINTFEATRGLSAQEAGQFRSTYRDVVLGESAVNDTLRRLLDMLPKGQGSDFSRVLETTREALGLDLAAIHPSVDVVRLQGLVSDLAHIKVISTVVDQCQELSETLTQRHGVAPFSATSMTSEMLSLTADRWVDASRLTAIGQRFNMQSHLEASVHFMTGLRNAIKDLPVQVFQAMEARQSLLDAAQAALDEAIDREEGLI